MIFLVDLDRIKIGTLRSNTKTKGGLHLMPSVCPHVCVSRRGNGYILC